MIKSFAALERLTREKIAGGEIPNLVAIMPSDRRIMEAIAKATESVICRPILIGPEPLITKAIAEAGADPETLEIVAATDATEAVKKAVPLALEKTPAFLLKGNMPTRDFVEVLLDGENGFRSGRAILSHVGLVQSDHYHKLMFITDGAVNPEPDATRKIEIIRNAASLAGKLGIDRPKAALLAAVEAIYPAMPVTMEAAAIAKMSDRGQIKEAVIDGPLSFDVAISEEVARSKGVTGSDVAGDTDIFVGPTFDTANGIYKALVQYGGAAGAGAIVGGKVAAVLAAAVDGPENIYNSLLLGALLSLAR